ncbi:HPr(Ser) kinase/phosphatase [[Mycoplasma] imitans]|uniref:HPr(Ser) kinase/phosphatase n=1 Tax=[Mycoplasma] imitans TaxID=29560 RepID=UPI0004897E63|nr:HPr(Ser) kinase/phosphatase [[Mycoplasma] imitans]
MSFTVKDIYDKFEVILKILDGEESLDREIEKPGLSRATFELLGSIQSDRIKNAVVFGNREYNYLTSLSIEERNRKIKRILELKPPVLILTKSFLDPSFLIECNVDYKVPIIATDMYSNELNISIGLYISKQLAKYTIHHGVLIEVYGEGVLITGESGIGKSEVAMEMLRKNFLFVADDAISIARIGDRLIGRPTEINKHFIEVRGIGILNVTKMYGIEKIKSSAHISVVVELINIRSNQPYNFERIGQKTRYKVIEDIKVPHYILPISSGRRSSELIESAVIDLKLKRDWLYNSGDDFVERYYKHMNRSE